MTDQTIGLPGIPAKRGRLRALAARLWRPGELRPATAWIAVALLAAAHRASFLAGRGGVRQHSVRGSGDRGARCGCHADRAARLVLDRPGRVARRRHRVGCFGKARDDEHGGARLRSLLLSELVVDRQLHVERSAPLRRGLDCRLPRDGACRAGSPIASTARAYRAAGPYCCWPCSYRWPGTAPTARASGATCSSTTRTCMCPRSMRRGARPWKPCGGAPCSRPRRKATRTSPSPFHRDATLRPGRRTSS